MTLSGVLTFLLASGCAMLLLIACLWAGSKTFNRHLPESARLVWDMEIPRGRHCRTRARMPAAEPVLSRPGKGRLMLRALAVPGAWSWLRCPRPRLAGRPASGRGGRPDGAAPVRPPAGAAPLQRPAVRMPPWHWRPPHEWVLRKLRERAADCASPDGTAPDPASGAVPLTWQHVFELGGPTVRPRYGGALIADTETDMRALPDVIA